MATDGIGVEDVTASVPGRSLRMLVGTWNVGNAQPPDDLSPWLPKGGGDYDLIVVGVQEATYKVKHPSPYAPETEVADEPPASATATPAISPSGSAAGTGAGAGAGAGAESESKSGGGGGTKQEKPPAEKNLPFFGVVLRHIGPEFEVVQGLAMWEIGALILVRKAHASHITNVESTTEATGILGITPNKGGVVIKLEAYGTSMCFVSSHLAAHLEHCGYRNSNYSEIIGESRLGDLKDMDFDSVFHHCFWLGDLNYRSDLRVKSGTGFLEKDIVSKSTAWPEVKALVDASNWNAVLAVDQLQQCQKDGLAFVGFQEAPIAFSPTFKLKRTPGFNYTEQRVPSYADRVLWKSLPNRQANVVCDSFQAHPTVFTSDHKPVSASFTVAIPEPAPLLAIARSRAPFLVITNLSGQDMFNADLTTSDPYIRFYTDPRKLLLTAADKAVTSYKRSTLHPRWDTDEVPPLRLGSTDLEVLSSAALMCCVMDKDVGNADDFMGQCAIPLAPVVAAGAKAYQFDVPITRHGVSAGRLRGLLQLKFPGDATFRRGSVAAIQKDRACCSIM